MRCREQLERCDVGGAGAAFERNWPKADIEMAPRDIGFRGSKADVTI